MDDKANLEIEHYHDLASGYFDLNDRVTVAIYGDAFFSIVLYPCLKCGALVADYCTHTRYHKDRNE